MQKKYEMIVILNNDMTDEDIDKQLDKIKEVIAKESGEVKNINKWGKRRLSFELKKSKKGFYVLIQFSCEPNLVQDIGQALKFVDGVERFMTVVASDRGAASVAESDLENAEEAVV